MCEACAGHVLKRFLGEWMDVGNNILLTLVRAMSTKLGLYRLAFGAIMRDIEMNLYIYSLGMYLMNGLCFLQLQIESRITDRRQFPQKVGDVTPDTSTYE